MLCRLGTLVHTASSTTSRDEELRIEQRATAHAASTCRVRRVGIVAPSTSLLAGLRQLPRPHRPGPVRIQRPAVGRIAGEQIPLVDGRPVEQLRPATARSRCSSRTASVSWSSEIRRIPGANAAKLEARPGRWRTVWRRHELLGVSPVENHRECTALDIVIAWRGLRDFSIRIGSTDRPCDSRRVE